MVSIWATSPRFTTTNVIPDCIHSVRTVIQKRETNLLGYQVVQKLQLVHLDPKRKAIYTCTVGWRLQSACRVIITVQNSVQLGIKQLKCVLFRLTFCKAKNSTFRSTYYDFLQHTVNLKYKNVRRYIYLYILTQVSLYFKKAKLRY